MDKNALAETRRETVIRLLKGMKIKKSDSDGFDKDDVYNCMQQLCDLYEKHIDELENNYESEISDLKSKYQKYEENNDLYVSLIMEAKKSSNDIINQAKTEVDEILASCKTEVAEQEQIIEQLKKDAAREKEDIDKDLAATRESAEAEKAAIKVEMKAEREKLYAVQSKYRQQVSSMDGEFDEIKTNILRAAASLDGLKAQVEEVAPSENVEWNISDDNSAVAFPDTNVAVEDILDITPVDTITSVDTPVDTQEENAAEIPVFEPVPEITPETPEATTEIPEATPETAGSDAGLSPDDSFVEKFFKSEILDQVPKSGSSDAVDPLSGTAAETVADTAGAPESTSAEIENFGQPAADANSETAAIPEINIPNLFDGQNGNYEQTPSAPAEPVIDIPYVSDTADQAITDLSGIQQDASAADAAVAQPQAEPQVGEPISGDVVPDAALQPDDLAIDESEENIDALLSEISFDDIDLDGLDDLNVSVPDEINNINNTENTANAQEPPQVSPADNSQTAFADTPLQASPADAAIPQDGFANAPQAVQVPSSDSDAPQNVQVPPSDAVQTTSPDIPQTSVPADEPAEEISFDDLEELFKDEK